MLAAKKNIPLRSLQKRCKCWVENRLAAVVMVAKVIVAQRHLSNLHQQHPMLLQQQQSRTEMISGASTGVGPSNLSMAQLAQMQGLLQQQQQQQLHQMTGQSQQLARAVSAADAGGPNAGVASGGAVVGDAAGTTDSEAERNRQRAQLRELNLRTQAYAHAQSQAAQAAALGQRPASFAQLQAAAQARTQDSQASHSHASSSQQGFQRQGGAPHGGPRR
jgi:hypothetical protein